MTNRKLFCIKCDELRDTVDKKTTVIHNIKGEEIILETLIPHCSECGIQLSDLDVEEKHFDMALYEYRRRRNLFSPNQIKSIREKYGLSQRAFSRALGFSEITINRYEAGALQDVTHNGILLLVNEPHNMLIIAQQNKNNLSEKEFKSIEDNVIHLSNACNDSIETIHRELTSKLDKMDKKLAKIDELDKKINFLMHNVKHHIDKFSTKPYEFKLDEYQKPPQYGKSIEELLYTRN